MWAKRDGKHWVLKEFDRSKIDEMKTKNKIIVKDHLCKKQENKK